MNNPRPCCGSDHTGPEHGPDCALPHESERDEMLAYLAEHLLGWTPCVVDDEACWSIDGWVLRDRKVRRDDFPKLLSGNGLLTIIDAMRERGWRVHTCITMDGRYLAECFKGEATGPRTYESITDSLPESVARAAYAALKDES